MADITEIAVAAWRLEKWLDNVNVERKMAAKSALRSIKKYLQENDIEVVDLTGAKFDVGLAVSVVNNESDETDEDKLIIREMVKPIIKEKGAVIQYGQVILGDEVKKQKPNNAVEESKDSAVEEAMAVASQVEHINRTDDDLPSQESVVEPIQSKQKGQLFAGISIVLLQIAIIIFLFRLSGKINDFRQYTESFSNDNKDFYVIETELSEMEGSISTLDEKISSIETRLEGIVSTIEDINASVNSISEYMLQEIGTENMEGNRAIEENTGRTDESHDAAREPNVEEENNTEEETEEEETEEEDYIIYIVKANDTLISICADNGIDYYANNDAIMELNGITDPTFIYVGQTLKLPKD